MWWRNVSPDAFAGDIMSNAPESDCSGFTFAFVFSRRCVREQGACDMMSAKASGLIWRQTALRLIIFLHIRQKNFGTSSTSQHSNRLGTTQRIFVHFTRTLTSKCVNWANNVTVDVMPYPTCLMTMVVNETYNAETETRPRRQCHQSEMIPRRDVQNNVSRRLVETFESRTSSYCITWGPYIGAFFWVCIHVVTVCVLIGHSATQHVPYAISYTTRAWFQQFGRFEI